MSTEPFGLLPESVADERNADRFSSFMAGGDPSTATDLRKLLIALNASTRLHRDSVCRLALGVDLWRRCSRPSSELCADLGVSRAQLEIALEVRDQAAQRARRQRELAARHGARIATTADDDYPQSLLELELPPPALYILGDIPPRPAISVVGSRSADLYGRQCAELFAAALARQGLIIVSGLARGIDSFAHSSALAQPGGSSLAVVGCGLDVDYPRGSLELRRRMPESGAILSEFAFSTPPYPANFPIRNRIIAALGSACLVIQAAPRSGSLVTARLALELGRDLYAVPGRIFDHLARGTNRLIRDGAFAVEEPRDIIDTLPSAVKAALRPAGDQPATETQPVGEEGRLLRLLPPGQASTAAELAVALELPLGTVHNLLLELELGGWVRRQPGALFSCVASRHL